MAKSEDRPALDAAGDYHESAAGKLVRRLFEFGIDGRGPLDSAAEHGRKARQNSKSDEDAIRRISRDALMGGGIGGFATGLGGFITMPVAIPVNVLEFYIQATRMVGAIATVRGYDLKDSKIRTAVLLTLVGSRSSDVLKAAGFGTPGGPLVRVALQGLPPEALMVFNKAIGVQLINRLGRRALTKLGRGIPIAGGVIGGGFDMWMMSRIANQARREFPATG